MDNADMENKVTKRTKKIVDNPEVPEIESPEESRTEKVLDSTGLFLEQLQQELKVGYRTFSWEDKFYRICIPSIKDDSELLRFKGKRTNELLKDTSLMMKDEIIKNLTERGIWDLSKEKKDRELRDRIGECMKDYYLEKSKNSPNLDRLRELREERAAIELDLMILSAAKDEMCSTSLEKMLEIEMLKYKIVLCVKDENDNRVWNSVEEYDSCSDKAFANSVATEATYFWAGLNQSMFD